MTNRRVLAAAITVAVLGGGSVAFVMWRSTAEREERVQTLVDAVASELALEKPEPADLRDLLRDVRARNETDPHTALRLAEAELLVALGRQGEAWNVLAPLVLAPGVSSEITRVGARVASAYHAISGDPAIGRHALAFASDHAVGHGDGSEADAAYFRALAWQSAFRLGDATAWAEATSAALVESASGADVRAIRLLARPLAGLLAARLGVDLSSASDAQASALGSIVRDAPASARRAVEDAMDAWPASRAELDLALAAMTIEELGAVGGANADAEVERQLRGALERCELALAAQPSSCDARHVAVIAYAGLRQAYGLRDDDLTRLRGHLRWLMGNAPQSHAARPVWQQLEAALRQ